jgi:hypothetical protein
MLDFFFFVIVKKSFEFAVEFYGCCKVCLAVPCQVCGPLVLQRALRGFLELDCCRVDGFEVFIALVVDLTETVIEREAFLGQGYFEF